MNQKYGYFVVEGVTYCTCYTSEGARLARVGRNGEATVITDENEMMRIGDIYWGVQRKEDWEREVKAFAIQLNDYWFPQSAAWQVWYFNVRKDLDHRRWDGVYE